MRMAESSTRMTACRWYHSGQHLWKGAGAIRKGQVSLCRCHKKCAAGRAGEPCMPQLWGQSHRIPKAFCLLLSQAIKSNLGPWQEMLQGTFQAAEIPQCHGSWLLCSQVTVCIKPSPQSWQSSARGPSRPQSPVSRPAPRAHCLWRQPQDTSASCPRTSMFARTASTQVAGAAARAHQELQNTVALTPPIC